MTEPASISFADAKNFKIPFGKHEGESIDGLAQSDDGLRYLDWLYGEMSGEPQRGIKAHFFDALKVYMEDSSIKKEVEDLR
jgi:hypothetical protein